MPMKSVNKKKSVKNLCLVYCKIGLFKTVFGVENSVEQIAIILQLMMS